MFLRQFKVILRLWFGLVYFKGVLRVFLGSFWEVDYIVIEMYLVSELHRLSVSETPHDR